MKVAERALPPALGLAGVAAVLGALQAEALLVFADPWLAWWPRACGRRRGSRRPTRESAFVL